MMRIVALCIFLLSSQALFAQEDVTVEAKLFLPTDIKNTLAVTDKLMVYLTPFPDDTAGKKQLIITAKKITGNIYEFKLPARYFWHIGFSIGKYTYQMMCVNNRDGDVTDNYDFNILLTNNKVDFKNIKFLPPCIRRDDE
jgi:hypothetical protein